MPSQHKHPPFRVRPPEAVRERLAAHLERTEMPVNKFISQAIEEKLEREMTYTAAIGTASDVVAGEFCDASVIINDAEGNLTDTAVMQAETEIRTDHEDVLGVIEADAERVLREHGWQIAGKWDVADNALYAPVKRA
jgi:hypothetical protein